MKNNITELVFILDKSGSMSGCEKDVIGGFNSMIKKQQAEEGSAFVSTVLFNNRTQVMHDRKPLQEVEPLTEEDYRPSGCTALLDALGGAISHVKTIHKYARKEDVPSRTIFVITTDGLENASRTYDSKTVKEMIKTQQENAGWEFLFLADNIDAVETALEIGIKSERAVNYSVKEQTPCMYEAVSNTILSFRKGGDINEDWNKDLKKSPKNSKN